MTIFFKILQGRCRRRFREEGTQPGCCSQSERCTQQRHSAVLPMEFLVQCADQTANGTSWTMCRSNCQWNFLDNVQIKLPMELLVQCADQTVNGISCTMFRGNHQQHLYSEQIKPSVTLPVRCADETASITSCTICRSNRKITLLVQCANVTVSNTSCAMCRSNRQ